ncbi:nucleotide exchange factor GrpE [Micromonospora sp. NPDC049559]|uniref:nucleotide exchange factor GrpE n=1 Tax=Micromonospora sp. NPDC049559 TaxID=3155923 RepID=UPI003448D764
MTEQPRAADPGSTGSAPGGSAPGDSAKGPSDRRIVIRDKRKIDPTGGRSGAESGGEAAAAAAPAATAPDDQVEPAESQVTDPAATEADETPAEQAAETVAVLDEMVEEAESEAEVGDGKARVPRLDQPQGAAGAVVDAPAEPADGTPLDTTPAEDAPVDGTRTDRSGPLGAELEALRAELDERTRDLQRVSAEYANYRKRVDRDRGLVAEQTTGSVLAALLPILDDLDRAREHGDLVGPFGTVAEQLTGVVTKLGLTAFGEKGDPFDPTRHEAVAHLTSADVTEPTCVDVMRRGYLLGERLLRPALVAVADPE